MVRAGPVLQKALSEIDRQKVRYSSMQGDMLD